MRNTPLSQVYKCNIAELNTVLKVTWIEAFLLKEWIHFSDLLDYSHSDLKEFFWESYEIIKINIYKLLKSWDTQRDIW
jgi:hypothetical protein